MNPLLESILERNILFELAGLAGLAFVATAAFSLSRKWHSWGGRMMGSGALALFTARLWHILAPHLYTDDVALAIGPIGNTLCIALPPLLLTFGFAGIVWGLWAHERWLKEGR